MFTILILIITVRDTHDETVSVGIEIRWIGMIAATLSAFKNRCIAIYTLHSFYKSDNVDSTKPVFF